MNVKLLLILLVAFCGCSSSASLKRSPYHYEYKNKFYYLETLYKTTWFKAFMACSKMGMELLSIDSDEEFDKIHEFVKDKMEYKNDLEIWTSGVIKEKDQFGWINSGNPVFSRWHPNQPNNYSGHQFCLNIWYFNKQFLLNDMECDTNMYFICESRKV
ncbi:PREDICTED: C-type lectin 37Db-like [Nicrophorus vespilloides]|uniref:C-type lectin 37Db-like n=1 Tax=Nicrophorus vespilloides TaxID=110193 RepID=A0ABM1M0Z9_NICVS|nr:PREDICTED: C-type lectin 37Db-like [Nicrophorus vespilloides]